MPNIGLDGLYYSKITEDAEGNETYATPKPFAKATSLNMNIDTIDGEFYADNVLAAYVKQFQSGSLSVGIDDLLPGVAADLIDVKVDKNGVVIATPEDSPAPVAISYRGLRSDGTHEYGWLYRVQFNAPASTMATKGNSIQFNAPTLEGKIMSRNKPDSKGNHPWRASVVEGATGVSAATISGWFEQVYEPDYTAA